MPYGNVVIATALLLVTGMAHAQIPSSERQRVVSQTLSCQDRCNSDLKKCFAPPAHHGPVTPVNPDNNGTIDTPQSYDECIYNRDICVAQCQVDQATALKQAATAARRHGTR